MPIGAIIGAVGNAISTDANNAKAQQREDRARRQNYQYGEMAANEADARTRELYNDLYSPEAQIKQLKAAGLSPSIFSSSGLAGKQGQSGAQGGGANISPNVFAADPIGAALAAAQIKKTEAETTKIESETDYTELQQESIKLQNEAQKLANEITTKGKDWTLKTMAQNYYLLAEQTELYKKQIQNAEKEGKRIELENKYNESTLEERIKQAKENTRLISQEVALKAAQEELAKKDKSLKDEEIKKIKEEVKEISDRITSRSEERRIHEKSVDAQKTFWEAQADYFTDQIEALYKRMNLDIEFENIKNEQEMWKLMFSVYEVENSKAHYGTLSLEGHLFADDVIEKKYKSKKINKITR